MRRQRHKHTAALRELKEQRQRKAKARLEAARQYIQALHEDRQDDFDDPTELGLEF